MTANTGRLFDGPDWDFATLQRIHDACEQIARSELGLDTYPNQIEIITSEQMLDAFASGGLPLLYKHWSFGKHFAYEEASYRKGLKGLAYEIVINSSPCIRGAPHSGFSRLIRRIRSRSSRSIFGRPPRRRDFQCQ